MNSKLKTQSLLLALVFCVSLFGAPFVFGGIPKNVEIGANLIENKIDFLIASLEEDPNITISENFKENSHIYKWIHYAIKNPDVPIYHEVLKAGQLHESGDPLAANIHLNQTIKKLLELVRVHEDLDEGTLDAIDSLIAYLDASPEAYGRAGISTSAASNPKGNKRDPRDLAGSDDTPGDFRYYGKEYLLDNVIMHDDGTLEFTEDGTGSGFDAGRAIGTMFGEDDAQIPPFLTPVYGYGGGVDWYWQDGVPIESRYTVSSAGPHERVQMENTAYRKYTWNVGMGDLPLKANASAILFEESEHSVIVFDYYNEPDVVNQFDGAISEDGYYGDAGAAAGLFPGDNSAGNPGPSEGRDWTSGIYRLFNQWSAHPLENVDNGFYTAMSNMYGFNWYERMDYNDILLDTMYVFWPEHWIIENDIGPHYRASLVPRSLVADSQSVYEALDNIMGTMDIENAPDSLENILNGKYSPGTFNNEGTWKTTYNPDGTDTTEYTYWEGGYEYGLQTVGQDDEDNPSTDPEYLPDHYIADLKWISKNISEGMLNSDGLLAYMVQVEEDRVNREIIDMAKNADAIRGRVSAYSALGFSDIRARDAAFVEMADAQAGKVLKDIHGNKVRVQQYILRPDNTKAQFLNVCLRGGDGPLAGFSTMDFTTTFAGEGYGINQDLRELPWDEWLDTKISDTRYVRNSSGVILDNMYVQFTNPGDESLKESRTFIQDFGEDSRGRATQEISSEQLTLYAKGVLSSYEYTSGSPAEGEYTVEFGDIGGFTYNLGGELTDDIQVAFHAVADEDGGHYPYPDTVDDIWDALAVNEDYHPEIGTEHNLEIIIDPTPGDVVNRDNNTFYNPIDVVYVPMSRMLWKDKEVVLVQSQL